MGPIGPAAFTPKGDWDSYTSYVAGDVVQYSGSTFYLAPVVAELSAGAPHANEPRLTGTIAYVSAFRVDPDEGVVFESTGSGTRRRPGR